MQFSTIFQLQKPRDLDLDLGSGQGHIGMHTTCRPTSMSIPNGVTIASRSIEIWPFEFREISTLRNIWTLVIAFLEGNSKIELRQAVERSHSITTNHQFWAPRQNGGGDRRGKVQFSELQKLLDLNLDLGSGRGHTGGHVPSRSTHTPNLIDIRKKTFCGRRNGRTHLSSNLLVTVYMWQ